MTISRRQARRQALFLLYQWDLSGQEIGSQYAGEIDPWARDKMLERKHAALVHELETDEVPVEVAISEAVGFTKRYASDDGARLVNGILGRIQREESSLNDI